jgi:NAD-dependent dihydropyrimidine dehydrogenase PreA subunit
MICPKKCIVTSQESNEIGYFPAQPQHNGCTGCTKCAIVCPEGIIEVCREDVEGIRIVEIAGRPDAPRLIEEKA